MRIFAALTVVVALAVAPAVASAATRRQATNQIARCMRHVGAARVIRHDNRGGVAMFPPRPFTSHRVQWGGYFLTNGQVKGTIVANGGLTAKQRRAANKCLRPFNGRAV
jgi:hypothetical protein